MFRNHEGYADPTAGSALAHVVHAERKQRKRLTQNQKKAIGTAATKAAPRNSAQDEQQRLIRKQQREAYYRTLTWEQAWPKPAAAQTMHMGGNE